MYIFYYFAAAIACDVLYKVTGVVSDRRKSCALGCKPGHLQKNRLPLGLDHLLRLEKADKEGLVTEEFVKIFAEEGRKTFTTNFLGSTVVRTCEPENMQALLATQFPDFVLGPLRRNTMSPLLGRGIFTPDGEAWFAPRSIRVEKEADGVLGNTPEPFFGLNSHGSKWQISSSWRIMSRNCCGFYRPTNVAGPKSSISPPIFATDLRHCHRVLLRYGSTFSTPGCRRPG